MAKPWNPKQQRTKPREFAITKIHRYVEGSLVEIEDLIIEDPTSDDLENNVTHVVEKKAYDALVEEMDFLMKGKSQNTNSTVDDRERRKDLDCSFCRPNKGENESRKAKHGTTKPKRKDHRGSR